MKTNTHSISPQRTEPHSFRRRLSSVLAAGGILLACTATAALNTNIANGDFATNDGGCYDASVNGWLQQSVYVSGAGIWTGCGPYGLFGSTVPFGSFIPGTAGSNQARIFQSLGTVDASDVGKVFTFTGGAAAWDMVYDVTNSKAANIVASFRTGTTTSAYGTLLGKASTVYCAVNNGNGAQDGVGDDGNFLQALSATFAPTAADIGSEVFVVLDLNCRTRHPAGENYYVYKFLSLGVTNQYAGAATNLVNAGFDSTNAVVFDRRVNGWLEHEVYAGLGPGGSGCGLWPYFGGAIFTNAAGGAMSFIPTAVGNNQAVTFQSLGFLSTNDLGKTLAFTVGAGAWDWWTNMTHSGVITVSFRKGMSPDGETSDFRYGTQLGTAGSVTPGLSGSNGSQDGVGDEGQALATIAALYTVSTNDIGQEVFVAVNLDCLVKSAVAENRYVVDKATLEVSSNTPPSVVITSPANGALVFVPTNLTLSATASDSDGSVVAVEFFSGVTSLGVVSNAPYNLTTSNATSGVVTYTARATDNLGGWNLSAPVTVTNAYPLSAAVIFNSAFSTNSGAVFDPTVDGWLEHEIYAGAGPNGSGCGIWSFFGTTISNASGGALSLIAANTSANTATVMQPLGRVDPGSVGKAFTFSAGAAAWDWFATVKPFSGTVSVSFRTRCVADNGNTTNFNYGTLLGMAGAVTTGVTDAGDGVQNGIGDDGALIPIAAHYSPSVGDVGKEVFAVINLGNAILAPDGENRFIVDNAALAVRTATAITLVSSGSPSLPGSNVTFTATITPANVTGVVVFLDGATPVSTNALSGGVAAFSTSSLAGGAHALTASFGGDVTYGPSVSATVGHYVGTPTTTLLESSSNPLIEGNFVGYTATVQTNGVTAGDATGTVVLLDGTNLLETMTVYGGVAYSTSYTPATGLHYLLAEYSGDSIFAPSTNLLLQVVLTGSQTATTNLLSASPNPSTQGGDVVFSVTVQTNGVAAGDATGTMLFRDGAALLSTSDVIAGLATCTNNTLSLGSHSITAEYSGDSAYGPSLAGPLVQVVQPGVPAAPTNIIWSVSGGQLTLSWPGNYQTWILQQQTNGLSAGLKTNWVDLGPVSGTTTNVPLNLAPAVFYRLRSP